MPELLRKRYNKKVNDVKTEKHRLGAIEMNKQDKPLNKGATESKPSTPAAPHSSALGSRETLSL